MNLMLFLLADVCLIMASFLIGVFAYSAWKKSRIETGLQIQCSSGDSEVMSFNYNFMEGESEDSKASKVREAFQSIQDRRDENHEKWLKIKADSQKQNEAVEQSGEPMNMKAVTARAESKMAN